MPAKARQAASNQRPHLSKSCQMGADSEKADVADGEISRDLVARIGAGDRGAEAELVTRYSKPLMLMLRVRTRGDIALAEDIHQDVFRIVIERLRGDGIDEPERVGAFIHSTGRFQLIGRQRRRNRRNTYADSELIDETITDDVTPVGEDIDLDRKRAAVRMMLQELPNDRDRALLTRFYLYEESKASICAALELSDLHFNRVLYRAKGRFRKVLEQDEDFQTMDDV